MEGKHLVVLCKISFGNRTVATHALIDCGATGIAFIDEDFARHHQLPLTPLQYPRSLEVIDGRPISSGDITYVANTHLAILEHQETLPMFVTKLGHYPVVLGIPWLELHDVAIRFSSRTLTFGSQYCTSHCNRVPTVVHAHSLASKIAHEEPVVSAGAGEFEAWSFTSPNSLFQNQVNHGKDLGMGARSSNWRARRNETSVFDEKSAALETSFFDGKSAAPETSVFDEKSAAPQTSVFDEKSAAPETSFFDGKSAAQETSVFDEKSPAPKTSAGSTFLMPDGPAFPTTERPIQISAIGGHPFRHLAYKQKLTIFSTSLY